jgi:hypothetical protein
MTRRSDSKANNYEVGYGRPPKARQFPPGRSGNPSGRRKGARSIGAILQDVVRQKITVTEGGKTRRVPALEGMLRRLRNDGLRGDAGAVKLLMALLDRYRDAPEAEINFADVLAEDREILEQYLKRPDRDPNSSSDTLDRSAAQLASPEGGDDGNTF